jgi:hypothetical protein
VVFTHGGISFGREFGGTQGNSGELKIRKGTLGNFGELWGTLGTQGNSRKEGNSGELWELRGTQERKGTLGT